MIHGETTVPFLLARETLAFPSPELALDHPDGLLAIGGDLSPERLLLAYRHGIFPWYSDGQPLLWWSPNPRSVLFPQQLKISRSLHKRIRRGDFEVRFDHAFDDVIEACSTPRADQVGTWITQEMKVAYRHIHTLGHAHSAESWRDGQLVGGLYGVVIGRVFFGESMFARVSDASKVAFVHLVEQIKSWGFGLIDCQISTAHLASLGAINISRHHFLELLDHYTGQPAPAPYLWRQIAFPKVARS